VRQAAAEAERERLLTEGYVETGMFLVSRETVIWIAPERITTGPRRDAALASIGAERSRPRTVRPRLRRPRATTPVPTPISRISPSPDGVSSAVTLRF